MYAKLLLYFCIPLRNVCSGQKLLWPAATVLSFDPGPVNYFEISFQLQFANSLTSTSASSVAKKAFRIIFSFSFNYIVFPSFKTSIIIYYFVCDYRLVGRKFRIQKTSNSGPYPTLWIRENQTDSRLSQLRF